jgi:hypothetical protein
MATEARFKKQAAGNHRNRRTFPPGCRWVPFGTGSTFAVLPERSE